MSLQFYRVLLIGQESGKDKGILTGKRDCSKQSFLWRGEPCAVSRRLWASCSALRGVSTLLRSGKHSVFFTLKGLSPTGYVHLGILGDPILG